MIIEISEKQLMTANEAREKYDDKYIGFVFIHLKAGVLDESIGYAACLADEAGELISNEAARIIPEQRILTILDGKTKLEEIATENSKLEYGFD